MSPGLQQLRSAYDTLRGHLFTDAVWYPQGQPTATARLLRVLVTEPEELASFGRPNIGRTFEIFPAVDEGSFKVGDIIAIRERSYYITEVHPQAGNISVRIVLGSSPIAGRQ